MRTLPKILTDEEINALYDYYHKTKRNVTNARDYSIVILMLEYGLRISEVTGATRDNIDVLTGRMKISGKGKKERIIYIQPLHLKPLKKWLDQRPESKWLFCSICPTRGKPGQQLDPRQIREKLYRVGKKTGISGLHPHRLRHTLATRLYEHTRDIVAVQEVLGHEHIATTRIYTHVSGLAVRNILQNYHSDKKTIDSRF